jgi:hypothetical protein
MLGNGCSVPPISNVFEPTGHIPPRTANKGLQAPLECADIMLAGKTNYRLV